MSVGTSRRATQGSHFAYSQPDGSGGALAHSQHTPGRAAAGWLFPSPHRAPFKNAATAGFTPQLVRRERRVLVGTSLQLAPLFHMISALRRPILLPGRLEL
jgi:hypothetical protein